MEIKNKGSRIYLEPLWLEITRYLLIIFSKSLGVSTIF